MYQLVSFTSPGGVVQIVKEADTVEPLVLRCWEGEWVEVTLENRLPEWYEQKPEPFAPEVPIEEVNPILHHPERRVSTQVSMHADIVLYDIQYSDGASLGRNPIR